MVEALPLSVNQVLKDPRPPPMGTQSFNLGPESTPVPTPTSGREERTMWRLTELATGGSKLPLRTSNHHSLTKALLYAQEHRNQDLGHRPTTSTEVEVGQRTALEAEDELLVPSGPASHVPGPPTDPGTPPELALDPASALGAHSSKGPQIDSGDPLPRPCEVAAPVERVWGPLGRTGGKAEA